MRVFSRWFYRWRCSRARARFKSHDELRREYAVSVLANRPETFVLYRIVGNDLPPRHKEGQSLANLRFILDHEPELAGCEKRWVLNRIVDPDVERALADELAARGRSFLRIPFDASEYAGLGPDLDCLPRRDFLAGRRFKKMKPAARRNLEVAVNRHRNNYVMNNNGARNAALSDGLGRAKWILPFDGNCFFTSAAWDDLVGAVSAEPWLRYFTVPMARMLDNRELLNPSFSPRAADEPQILFRCDAGERFNEAFPYGRRPKVELFWRLGIPGPWDDWAEKPWDQPRRELAPEAGQFAEAGWVARLFSGEAALEGAAASDRGAARQQAILTMLGILDKASAVR